MTSPGLCTSHGQQATTSLPRTRFVLFLTLLISICLIASASATTAGTKTRPAQAATAAERRARALWHGVIHKGKHKVRQAPIFKRLTKTKGGQPNGCNCGARKHKAGVTPTAIAVRALVIRSKGSNEHTRGGRIPQFLIRWYVLQVTKRIRGNWHVLGGFFQAQGFVHDDACGLRLKTGTEYILHLDHPKDIPPGLFWRAGIFVIGQCNTKRSMRELPWCDAMTNVTMMHFWNLSLFCHFDIPFIVVIAFLCQTSRSFHPHSFDWKYRDQHCWRGDKTYAVRYNSAKECLCSNNAPLSLSLFLPFILPSSPPPPPLSGIVIGN